MSCAPNELCGDCPDREACHEATECLHGDRPTTADVAAPEEAVEAVAKALAEAGSFGSWDEIHDSERDYYRSRARIAAGAYEGATLNVPSIRDAFAPVRPITPRELARAMFFGRLSDPNGDDSERAWIEAGGDRGALDYGSAMVLQQLRSGRDA